MHSSYFSYDDIENFPEKKKVMSLECMSVGVEQNCLVTLILNN